MIDLYQLYENKQHIKKNLGDFNVFLKVIFYERFPYVENKIYNLIRDPNPPNSIQLDSFGIKFDNRVQDKQRVHLLFPNSLIRTIDLQLDEKKTTKDICDQFGDMIDKSLRSKGFCGFQTLKETNLSNCSISMILKPSS